MKITAATTLAALFSCAAAFAPAKTARRTTISLNALDWSSPESLPGVLPPVGFFDPFNLCKGGEDPKKLKQYREAETQHGRVAMLAALGIIVTEEPIEFHPLFEASVKDIGPAIRHLDEVRAVSPYFFEWLAILIGSLEINRALQGWKAPGENAYFQELNDDYYPGDVGFDPLGLKPEDPDEFFEMSTKELQNGRLAMLAAAGFIAQELTNGKEIFVNLGLAQDRFDPSSVPIQF